VEKMVEDFGNSGFWELENIEDIESWKNVLLAIEYNGKTGNNGTG